MKQAYSSARAPLTPSDRIRRLGYDPLQLTPDERAELLEIEALLASAQRVRRERRMSGSVPVSEARDDRHAEVSPS
ncbi:MAG: hypothetical protein WD737_11815 [Gemmatimonadota bacterium]